MSPGIAPVMSTNVWEFIAQHVGDRERVSVLEYGSGGSTVYLHRMLMEKAERGNRAPAPQMLVAVEQRKGRLHRREIASCVFVPLLGKYGWSAESE